MVFNVNTPPMQIRTNVTPSSPSAPANAARKAPATTSNKPVAPPVPAPPERGFFESIIDNVGFVLGGIGMLVLLLIAVFSGRKLDIGGN